MTLHNFRKLDATTHNPYWKRANKRHRRNWLAKQHRKAIKTALAEKDRRAAAAR